MVQRHSLLVGLEPGVGIGGLDLVERVQEAAAEITDAGESLPELLVQGDPGD
jgi:hypothetical protein